MSLWVLPLPFFSHVLCASQVGAHIARHGVSVRIFTTTSDRNRLANHMELLRSWAGEGLDIQVRALDCEAAALADSVGDRERFIKPFLSAEDAFEGMLKQSVEDGSQPACVLTDLCVPRAKEAAQKLGIASWVFSPMAASCTASFIYVSRLLAKGVLRVPATPHDENAQEMVCLPGLRPMRLHDMAEVMLTGHVLFESIVKNCFELMEDTDVVVVHSLRELEPRAFLDLEALLRAAAERNLRKAPEVLAVGPSCPIPRALGLENLQNLDPCIEFLSSQPLASVVYVAFGGDVNFSEEQIQELVYGLEGSTQPFLCVLHPPQKGSGASPAPSALPEDLLGRIAGRSLFVKWAPQVRILAHPSTGAFITHCGFNSVLEGVALGVPLLAWPQQYEQFMNCRFLVDEAQLALEVAPQMRSGKMVGRNEVEMCVKGLFRTEEGLALRKRAEVMKGKAEAAVGPQGSTTANLRALVARIQKLAAQK